MLNQYSGGPDAAPLPVGDPNQSYRDSTILAHYQAVERVIQAMHERLNEPFSMQAMARVAFVSPYHFNRMFRQITGIPPSKFLYALRLEAARRLLLTTRLSVLEVCYEVGYNSLGTFTRRFGDLIGTSPTRLRSMARYPAHESFDKVKVDLNRSSRRCLYGEISAPPDFCGQIFIGLFPSQIPQGAPSACALLNQSGQYQISRVPDGNFFLFAAGISSSQDPMDYLHYESALRAGGQAIRIDDGRIDGDTTLTLRLPTIFDPPILMTFPALLAKARSLRGEEQQQASISASA